jgi:DNA-binding protein H-NS
MSTYGHLPAMQQMESLHKEMHELVHSCISNKQGGNSQAAQNDYQNVATLSDKIVNLLTEVEASVTGKQQASPAPAPTPVARKASAAPIASSGNDDEWEEF